MNSGEHLSTERWLEYYLADPAVDDAGGIEEHLFECGECGAVLAAIHRTAAAIVGVVRGAALGSGGTTALLNRMSRDRLNVRHYVIEPGETVACTVAADDDFMAGRFVLPPGEFERIDMRVLAANGDELMRVNDIVVDVRYRHAVVFIPARPVQKEESGLTQYALVVPDGTGDREIARYSMDHAALGPNA